MKILMKILAGLIILIETFILFVCVLLLIEFFENPEPFYNYYFRSEAMVENGGWQYSSVFSYIFFNAVMILSSVGISIFSLKIKQLKHFLLLLFIIICQVLCFFFL